MSDVKKRIIDYETAGEVNEDFYLLGDNGTEGTFKIPVKAVGPIESICPVYDAEAGTYDEGDYCFHDQKMYQCNTDISVPEDFDPTKWDEVTIAEIMASQQSEISTLNSNLAQLAHYRCIAVYNTLVSVTNGEATFDITSLGLSEKPLFDVFPNSGDDARLNVNCNINSTTATSLAFKVSRWDGNGSYTHKPTTNARFIIFVYQPN